MKASKLIAILAQHLTEHGDYEVFIPTNDLDRYAEITRCWYNYGEEWGDQDRIIIETN